MEVKSDNCLLPQESSQIKHHARRVATFNSHNAPQSLQGFAGIMNVQRLGEKMSGSLTAASLAAALKHVSDLQSFAGPVLNASDHLPGLANIYLTGAYLYTYSDGKFTLDGSGLTQAAK